MLTGGRVNRGRVIADWPGLATADLYDQRDLRPTSELDAVIAVAVAESLVFDPDRVRRGLFTRATRERPLAGLLRT